MLASEGLLIGVLEHVRLQMTQRGGRIQADVAFEALLAFVRLKPYRLSINND